MEFVIITGMSGSGKSRAIAAMEDIGYYCVDNLPPRMVKSFTDLCLQAADKVDKVAIVIDARSREIFGDIFEGIEEFLEAPGGFQLMFLDCTMRCLSSGETRRKHPLMNDKNTSIEAAVAEERRLLSKVRDNANYVIDTTYLSVRQLRDKIIATF
ncbi:MAG: RNase adapter RapZ [Merdibacter sp.]